MFQTMRFRTPVIIFGMNTVNLIGEEFGNSGGKASSLLQIRELSRLAFWKR